MTTPLILGNDFVDQYSLSVKRVERKSFLEFGDSRRSLDIANSVSPDFVDEEGHVFKVRRISETNQSLTKSAN